MIFTSSIQGTETCPVPNTQVDNGVTITLNEDEIFWWNKKDCYARLMIFNANDETRQKALLNCKSANEMWTRLNTQYLQRAADNKHLLHREFLNLRYSCACIL